MTGLQKQSQAPLVLKKPKTKGKNHFKKAISSSDYSNCYQTHLSSLAKFCSSIDQYRQWSSSQMQVKIQDEVMSAQKTYREGKTGH
jgi:hypothetical protein